MKKTLSLLLLLALLLPTLVACQSEEPETPGGTPALLVLPENVNYVSIYLYKDGSDGGGAYFDKNNYGALLQLLDELRATTVIPLTDETAGKNFLFDDCFDLNVYGADGTLMQISVDTNGLICINTEFFTLSEGLLSYKRVQSYFEAFHE